MKTTPANWRMDVMNFRVDAITTEAGSVLRLSGVLTPGNGIYCLIPLRDWLEEDSPAQRAQILAVDLDNGFKTMVWLYEHPEEALEQDCLTAQDVTNINHFKAKEKE